MKYEDMLGKVGDYLKRVEVVASELFPGPGTAALILAISAEQMRCSALATMSLPERAEFNALLDRLREKSVRTTDGVLRDLDAATNGALS